MIKLYKIKFYLQKEKTKLKNIIFNRFQIKKIII
jgi:hypothetical protein